MQTVSGQAKGHVLVVIYVGIYKSSFWREIMVSVASLFVIT